MGKQIVQPVYVFIEFEEITVVLGLLQLIEQELDGVLGTHRI